MCIVVLGVTAAEAAPLMRHAGPGMRVVAAETVQQVRREAQHGRLDGVVVAGTVSPEAFKALSAAIGVSTPLIVSGSLAVPDACDGMCRLLDGRHGSPHRGFQVSRDSTFKEYIEAKFGEFVRAMKASAARGLHATLMQAVEQPLIQHALRETDGNQIQAARLLGMNRNTLRKKIKAYRIPVPRRSPARPPSLG